MDWIRAINSPSSQRKGSNRYNNDNIFNGFLEPIGLSDTESPLSALAFSPKAEVVETNEKITYKIEVPGIDPKNISILVDEDSLTVKGEKHSQASINGAEGEGSKGDSAEHAVQKQHLTEFYYGKFERQFAFPCRVDVNEGHACSLKDGVLTIEIKKLQENANKAKKLEITY
jgi:HSP20 family protein